jgi:hypothetical protein
MPIMENSGSPGDLWGWKKPLLADLAYVARRDRWGQSLIVIGWIHLAAFLSCQALYSSGDRKEWPPLVIWGTEFGMVLLALKWISGAGWFRSTPLAALIVRVWATFLILSFNLASLNSLSGWDYDWFKPPLATLSSFGFMCMAYLLGARFFLLAVVMYFTGLLMLHHPSHAYLIYGLSWWGVLQTIGLILEWKRLKSPAGGAVGRRAELGRAESPLGVPA